MTHIEILDADRQIAGFFFTGLPIQVCALLRLQDYRWVVGRWFASGGVAYEESTWYLADVVVGEIVEVDN